MSSALTPHELGYLHGQTNSTLPCPFEASTNDYREYFQGHFEATQDGENQA
jgi:hypothetical protein